MANQLLLFGSLLGATVGKIYFNETFENLDRWTEAEGKTGLFGLAKEEWGLDTKSTRLKTLKDGKFYAIAAKIDEPLDNSDKPLVLMLHVKHEKVFDCGGGYLKLMNKLESLEKFDGDTQYEIMFGPDVCGESKKLQAILRHEEKNLPMNKQVYIISDQFTHQYIFVLNPDDTFVVKVDGIVKQEGNVLEFWDFELPKKINDPAVSKPVDWIDEPKMDNPDEKKPEDWVEDKKIVDPKAKKPDAWDDEDDGEWVAPIIYNPAYQGEWSPKKIDNPDYKGP